MTAYRKVVIRTYSNEGEPSGKARRAHPVEGQLGFNKNMHVECSSKMRDAHPAGTYFLIDAKVTSREGGPEFVYTSFRWAYDVLTKDQAAEFIKAGGFVP